MRASILPALLLGLSPLAVTAQPYGGSYQYNLRYLDAEGSRGMTTQTHTLGVQSGMPLWRDWLGRLEGQLNLSTARTTSAEGTSEDQLVTGRGNLGLFPYSSFPLEASLERSDSRVDAAAALRGQREVLTYGLTQQYRRSDGERYTLRYRRREVEGEQSFGSGNETERDAVTQETAELSAGRSWSEHHLDYDLRLQRFRDQLQDDRQRDLMHVLRHQYLPGEDFSLSNLASYGELEYDYETGGFEERTTQLNSVGFWRPETERPSRITGNLLYNTRRSVNNAGRSIDILSGGLDSSYDISSRLAGRAALGFTREEEADRATLSSFQQLGLSYSPEGWVIAGFDYGWSARRTTTPLPGCRTACWRSTGSGRHSHRWGATRTTSPCCSSTSTSCAGSTRAWGTRRAIG